MPAWRGASRRWCRSTSMTRTGSSAPTTRPTTSPTRRRDAFMQLVARSSAQRFAQDRRADRARPPPASPTCSSPPPTACRSSSAASCASTCRAGTFLESSSGVTVTDLDGNVFYDLTGSYGVNLFGYDFYKDCIERAASNACARSGRCSAPIIPSSPTTSTRLREISGLDEVSFHMSGTEAVMQAVRLARYHTGRSHLVRFCGAYHGWWGDVQPGVGNPLAGARDLYAGGNVRDLRCACCDAARHRLRAGQSAAGAASERRRAGGFLAGRQRPRRAFRPRGLYRMAAASCARCAPSAASS